MQFKPITAIAVLLVVVVSLSVAGCTVNFNAPASSATPTAAPTTAPNTITQTASSDPSLSTFVNLLNKANMTGVLDGKGNFTVFAPDNTAFSKVDASTLAGWQSNTKTLRNVLWYHIAPTKILSSDFTGRGTLTTMNGLTLPYSVTGNTLKVDNATVTQADINAANGVIHKIDTVLMPP
jgi:uncharacterized surface protein with fasciclin (FAS1) repeats